jgi:HEAT repeat protein
MLLLLQMRDSHSWVRWEAAKALGQLEEISDDAVDALLNVLYDEDALVRTRAVETLNAFEMPSDVLLAFIHVLMSDTNSNVRARIVECLGDIDQPSDDVVQALLKAVHDTEDHVRARAVESLGNRASLSPKVLKALLFVLRNDTFFGARWAVVKSLKSLKELPEKAVFAVVQALLEDAHEAVRQDCAHFLGQGGFGDKRTIEALLKGLSDPDQQVRIACSQALVRLGQRFPERKTMITMQLERIVQSLQKETISYSGWRAPCDVAYDALWLLVNEETLEGE